MLTSLQVYDSKHSIRWQQSNSSHLYHLALESDRISESEGKYAEPGQFPRGARSVITLEQKININQEEKKKRNRLAVHEKGDRKI